MLFLRALFFLLKFCLKKEVTHIHCITAVVFSLEKQILKIWVFVCNLEP